ncbi:MAG: D-glycero-beta-D-manno-heptose 1,7-bisphosphate 7-phosphatase [Desulfuromonadales bacterium]
MRRAAFLDRDGTINIEKGYLYQIDDFEFIPGASEAIRMLNEAGYFVAVVSNQSGIARGYYTEDDVELLHRHIAAELQKSGAQVDTWMFCPHHPHGRGSYGLPCACRKPLPGMLQEAARRFDLDLNASVMIGDKSVDVEAGSAAGCRSILVRTGCGAEEEAHISTATEVYDDLLKAAYFITKGNVP